jgi:hypothetical protein
MTGISAEQCRRGCPQSTPLSVATSAADLHSQGVNLLVFDWTSLTPCSNKAFVSAKSRGEYAQCPRKINGGVRGIGHSAALIQPQTGRGLGLSMSTNSPWSRSVHGRALATTTDCPQPVHGLELSVDSPRTHTVHGQNAAIQRPFPSPPIGPRMSASWLHNGHAIVHKLSESSDWRIWR